MSFDWEHIDGETCLKRQLKVFRRRRIRRQRKKERADSISRFEHVSVLAAHEDQWLRELTRKSFVDPEYIHKTLYAPINFTFRDNFNECIIFYKELLSSFILGIGDIIIDFEACIAVDLGSFALFDLLINQLKEMRDRYNFARYNKTSKTFIIKPSKNGKVNKYLAAFKYHRLDIDFLDDSMYLPLSTQKGRKRSGYKENTKAISCSRIVKFLSDSLAPYDVRVTMETQNQLENFLSEILNNAEDHSFEKSHWYVYGISFHETQYNTDVIELNLAIMNLGLSMYEGFEATKNENESIYNKLCKIFDIHDSQKSLFKSLDRESLFMLYMLNEGISRLKYQDDSRGNGTMNFINAFMSLGAFGDENKSFPPLLQIASGHGLLLFDNKYKPFNKGNFMYVSLNKEKDIRKLPDERYVKSHREFFPGTILDCKIYFNKEFINKQINK